VVQLNIKRDYIFLNSLPYSDNCNQSLENVVGGVSQLYTKQDEFICFPSFCFKFSAFKVILLYQLQVRILAFRVLWKLTIIVY